MTQAARWRGEVLFCTGNQGLGVGAAKRFSHMALGGEGGQNLFAFQLGGEFYLINSGRNDSFA